MDSYGLICKARKSKTVTILIWAWLTAIFIGQFLLSSSYGILVTTGLLYYFSPALFGVEPYSSQQLFLFLSTVDKEYKIAIISSVITVIGFLLAFSSSRAAVKSQLLLQYRTAVADDINDLVNQASYLANAIKIKSDLLQNLKERIARNSFDPELPGEVKHILSLSEELNSEIRNLSNLVSSAYSLSSRHSALLAAQAKLDVTFNNIIICMRQLSEASWFYIPNVEVNSISDLEQFGEFIDAAKCKKYNLLYDSLFDQINSYSGSMRAVLLHQVIGYRWGHLRGLVSLTNPFTPSRKEDFNGD